MMCLCSPNHYKKNHLYKNLGFYINDRSLLRLSPEKRNPINDIPITGRHRSPNYSKPEEFS